MLDAVVGPARSRLAVELRSVPGLSTADGESLLASATLSLRDVGWRRVSRVLLLELHAARLAGRLTAADEAGRWAEWVETVHRPDFWETLTEHYPPLLTRLRTVIDHRRAAALRLARRFARDRAMLSALAGHELGALQGIRFGAGDSHCGGETVAALHCESGKMLYKPRSLAVDAVLGRVLPALLPASAAPHPIRVPRVLERSDRDGTYGWCDYVAHRYCADQGELATFYRNLGHWLAVMRLLGGSDLHAENVIAAGPVPVVVDCETLFTPHFPTRPSGYGAATDLAADLLNDSVMRTGLLPGRGGGLGFRGIDPSAAGALPGQQATVSVPVIVDEGTDRARVGSADLPPPPTVNHPSPEPELGRHWPQVVAGFAELTEHLHRLDQRGELAPRLAEFADCPTRVVLRDTIVYSELGRMLWHPSSLHRPDRAAERAADLLARHADRRPGAPSDRAVIEAEVAALQEGDVPIFTTTPGRGELTGPGGTRCGEPLDLVDDAVRRWRALDPATDQRVVQAALVGAYLNDGWLPPPQRLPVTGPRLDDLDRQRREQAAAIMRDLVAYAITGPDETATWVAPVLNATGWSVQPLPADLYGGVAGVAVLLAAYQREVAAGRAEEVAGAAELLPATLATLRAAEAAHAADLADARERGVAVRPEACGGYIGLGSRIWSWLLLWQLGAVPGDQALAHATALAAELPAAVAADESHDLLLGAAGSIVPLLRLAEASGEARWQETAVQIGHRLAAHAEPANEGHGGLRWLTPLFPAGVGGLSHGSTGIGWALARLAVATAEPSFAGLAEEAFDFESSLYDPALGGWRDLRSPEPTTAAAWCHGAVGIGIAAADLRHRAQPERWREVLAQAAAVAWPGGVGWNHTLCHGDFGAWELFEHAWAAKVGSTLPAREEVLAALLGSLAEHGAVSGLARDVFAPGLLPGQGGIVYQLLRMHPEAELPSVSLPDPGPPPAGPLPSRQDDPATIPGSGSTG
ncbi:type 2 lantipeptide synthetase LanM family protein [Natronosporangium hydrolyticum]|uniref:Type 2 lantipeptide synthetase LanM family protein n=2 Tax=Natronosporangium hydrolyticum TaxID=2811111 RepID=A0A895YTD8_9ACTN|nr:type 2 lanthipeptide synthetase LanM family protein [Natronosporangium hydrolyticum]QSB17370.1 type 2 lantipeptide synthetase LanM family protein [Natronosporangium hydrolyticum]